MAKQDNICAFNAWSKILFLRNLIPYVLSAALPFYLEASKYNIYLKEDLAVRLRHLQKSDEKISAYLKNLRPLLAAVRDAEFAHPMRTVPTELQYLHGLKQLRISTGLVTLNSSVGSLIHLRQLSLANNALRGLPFNFIYLQEITELRLDHNAFKEVPLVVCHLRKLQFFSIRHNQIEKFPVESSVWQDLTHIDFSHNHCREMPVPLSYCRSLRFIYARHNRIQVCPKLKTYPVAEVIDLEGNPIQGTRYGVRIVKQKPKPSTIAEQECRVKSSHAVGHTSRYAKLVKSRSI